MTYHRIIAARPGGLEVLQVVDEELRLPAKRQVRIRVLAAAVRRPDITVRQGKSLYYGTPLGQNFPFTPGYAVIGEVDAVGAEVRGCSGRAEGWGTDGDRRVQRVPVLAGRPADPRARWARPGASSDTGAELSGGVPGAAPGGEGQSGRESPGHRRQRGDRHGAPQLGNLAGLKLYGLASQSKHEQLKEYGATLIDYHSQDFVEVIRQAEPDGLDVVIDGMSGEYIQRACRCWGRAGGW